MKKVKNILVATDFSVTARNAYHYAKRLAQLLDATITVVHIDDVYAADTPEIPALPILEHIPNRYDKEMELFVTEENDRDSLKMANNKVKTLIIKGLPVTQLVKLSEDSFTDMIVIGTTGFADIISKIVGTTSLGVANQAHCPVLLVPRDAKWRPIDRIMYASDDDSVTPQMVNEISTFAIDVKASVHFVHIATNEPKEDNKNVFVHFLSMLNPALSYEIHTVYGVNHIKSLKEYAHQHKINLMAFVSKHRSFWERLMYNSTTEDMALSTDTPMMVIHTDDAVVFSKV